MVKNIIKNKNILENITKYKIIFKNYFVIFKSVLFDKKFYMLNNHIDKHIPALLHYLTVGWKTGCNPNPFFDVNWYLEENKDIKTKKVEPLTHFILHGWKEQRNPSPFFDISWYFSEYNDEIYDNQEPLSNYLSTGWKANKKPKANFSAKYFFNYYPILKTYHSFSHQLLKHLKREKNNELKRIYSMAIGGNKSKKISTIITSFNHEKYIFQCIESILNQKGNYELEIIIGDDCSFDRTPEILRMYMDKNPDSIRVLYNDKNLGKEKNLERCLKACTGDFVAICEGDDYWIDELKLQIQMDFLQTHTECSMCFNQILLYIQEKDKYIFHNGQKNLGKDFLEIEDLIKTNYIGNFSCCMYTKDVINQLPQEIFKINFADWLFNMACSEIGKIGFIKDIMSVYRIHKNGLWSGKTRAEQSSSLIKFIEKYNKFFNYKYDKEFSKQREQINN